MLLVSPSSQSSPLPGTPIIHEDFQKLLEAGHLFLADFLEGH